MAETLIAIAATALDWALAAGVWWVFKRVSRRPVPARVDLVAPWALLHASLVAGALATGAVAATNTGAVVLTALPIALFSAFFAVPLALFRARGGKKIEWRLCLDHTLAAAAVWGLAAVVSVPL